ncbi:HNH endonuclease [Myceligenerans xiligouense]|uniref:Uncharacterized protein DUF222 n=1 Tax=Myceligenerans xiligouense TaxID=253184 RepID=A0A3N4YQQ3_9MICO|nr:DUF222 domain-containing protein [Myceligenerans xiligouense]RPF21836.1 uncharacterized protein DUF222 [Myceligenerans xiligouense]
MTMRRAVGFLPGSPEGAGSAATPSAAPVAADVARMHAWLLAASKPGQASGQVEMLRALEDLSGAIAAVQAQLMVELDQTTRAEARQMVARTEADPAGRSVPVTVRSAEREAARSVRSQVGLALRVSPHRAGTLIGVAKMLHAEMPATLGALRAGRLPHERAIILVKETACLEADDRARIDAELCADPATLEGIGTRQLEAMARARAAELDPAAAVRRAAKAAKDRYVSIRPAPDAMVRLSALLPVAEGVRTYAALKQAADTARTDPDDDRNRHQVMADTLVERVTGQETAGQVPVTVNLIVSDRTLLAAGHEPAVITDVSGTSYGPVPAQVARNLTATGLDVDAAWLRTIYASSGGDLIAAGSKRRFFAGGLADLLRVRDQGICRTPWCDAPARHLDHAKPATAAGPTTLDNGQGLCEACNQAKEAPGWNAAADTDPTTGRHRVTTTTPAGLHYASVAPPPPRPA